MNEIEKLENNVSRETIEMLKVYQSLLIKWQKAINLVSKNTLDNIWERHILDSLQLINHLPDDKKISIVDLGSGAGFPPLVLAIAGYKNVTAIESDERKCLFMETVAKETNTKINIINDRIENVKNIKADIITARALAKIDQLLSLSKEISKKDTNYLFLKGKNTDKEVKNAKGKFDFEAVCYKSLTNSEAKVVKISNLKYKN